MVKRIHGLRATARHASVQAFLVLALVPSSLLQAQEAYSQVSQQEYPPGLYAEFTTPKGLFVISLAFDRVPMTVANFVGLAEGTIRNQAVPEGTPFYDGTVFHRVAPGHVIQAGRSSSEVASTPGYSIPNEIHATLGHGEAGMVGLANGGPHTGKAEFYITLGDRSYLDGDYAVFGQVYEGMGVVRQIVGGDPIERVRVIRIGPEAGAFRPTTESFRRLRREVRTRVVAEEEVQKAGDLAYLEASWPNAVHTESGWSFQVIREGRGAPLAPGDTAMVRYTGRTVRGLAFASIAESGDPDYIWPRTEAGECFSFVVGEDVVNRGFDEAVSGMTRGEKRLIIVPSEMAYDPVGFYGTEESGIPRFVIRPRSILIYEVEVLAR